MRNGNRNLWHKVLAGDAAAWETTVRTYQSLVYTIALRSGLSRSDAADCFQHTWLMLWENRLKITNPDRLSAWIATTAKREALRIRRRESSSKRTQLSEQHIDGNPLPDEEVIRLEQQAHLESAIRELGPRCRKLVEFMFFAPEASSYEEIAEKLGVAFNSLGPLRRRCLNALKKILIRNGFL